MEQDTRVAAVLDFWFAPGMEERWFIQDSAFDKECRERLLPLYESAAAGELEAWREAPKACLALCILLDQIPRNLYRGEARAYATDGDALAAARHALAEGYDRQFSQVQRAFFYMPLEHSETLSDQEDCVALMATLDERPDWGVYAAKHRDVIARFGRFPYRNDQLGRESTAEEMAFLEAAADSEGRWW